MNDLTAKHRLGKQENLVGLFGFGNTNEKKEEIDCFSFADRIIKRL